MTFKQFINIKNLHPLDHCGQTIRLINGVKLFEDDCLNKSIISESSLSRILDLMNNKVFVIMSAYRAIFTKEQNIIRNRKLRAQLNDVKMGVHQLIGHWQECQLKNADGENVPYKECPKDQLKDVIERSYLIVKPNDKTREEFEAFIQKLMTIEGETQDGVLIKDENNHYSIMDKSGNKFQIGQDLKLNQIGQAYSQHVKKQNVPFVFEGAEVPNGSIISYQLWNMKDQNFKYVLGESTNESTN